MQDLRYIRTEKSIRDAFFKLLSQKNLSQITVTELSKEAFLGRGTFYLHYTDIYELFSAITKEHISNIFKIYSDAMTTYIKENSAKLTYNIIDYVKENMTEFQIIANNTSTQYFFSQIMESQISAYTNEPLPAKADINFDEQYDLVEASFIVAGFINVLFEWAKGNIKLTDSDLADKLNRVLSHFI